MTRRAFKVWRDTESSADAVDIIGCHTPMQAACEYGDYAALEIGEMIRVNVQDECGNITYWLVGATRRCEAQEFGT